MSKYYNDRRYKKAREIVNAYSRGFCLREHGGEDHHIEIWATGNSKLVMISCWKCAGEWFTEIWLQGAADNIWESYNEALEEYAKPKAKEEA